MKEKKVTVTNAFGIHCRPSAIIVKATRNLGECSITLETANGKSSATDMMGMLAIGMEKGVEVTVQATGDGEDAACEEIAALVSSDFDFQR